MKLYTVPKNTKVRLLGELLNPPGAPELDVGTIVLFKYVDGIYSYCLTDKGEVVHPVAWSEVEIMEDKKELDKSV